MNIKTSGYGLVDITVGRSALKKHVEKGGTVKVVIYAEITEWISGDDGVSREFQLDISKMQVKK